VNEITELRRTLLELNKDLSNLTRELHKSNAELTKLNDQKNTFLGMAAHDLRGPISNILMYSDFLIDELETNNEKSKLDLLLTIKRASRFMLNLINNLLDISKIEAGHLHLEYDEYDFNEVVMQNIKLNSLLLKNKQIKLRVSSDEKLPAFRFDRDKIDQVFNNLLSNAIKFSPEGSEILVNISAKKNMVQVSVKDNGPGIPAEEHSKLFKPFSKTSVKSSAGEKNTGLGLAIVKRIVEEHGGEIWFESEPGNGTTFYFTLPIKN
jgi:signal transduction histidine kinase